jgi:hypothetical protein
MTLRNPFTLELFINSPILQKISFGIEAKE